MSEKNLFNEIIREEEIKKCLCDYLNSRMDLQLSNLEKKTLEEILELFEKYKDVDQAISTLLKNQSPVDLDVKAIQKVVRRQKEIINDQAKVCLKIYCSLEITSLTIPDPQKDEIVLNVLLFTGVNISSLKEYLLKNELCTKNDFRRYEKNWVRTDINIDMENREKILLEKILRLDFLEGFNNNINYICYNYYEAEEDKENIAGSETMIWRACAFSSSINKFMVFKGYPFDFHKLSFYLVSPDSYDVTDKYLIPFTDKNTKSLIINNLIPPRGFKVATSSGKLLDVAMITRVDVWPESKLRFEIGLLRVINTFLWHTFIPSSITLVFAFIATAFVFWGDFQEIKTDVITQVIPAILISVSALQLVASQNVPPNSGHTAQDNFFVTYYLCLLLLFISHQIPSPTIANFVFIASLIFFLIEIAYIFIRSIKRMI